MPCKRCSYNLKKKNKPWQKKKKYFLGEKDIFALLLLTHFFRSIRRIVAHHVAVTHFNCCLSRQEKASTCYQLASLAVNYLLQMGLGEKGDRLNPVTIDGLFTRWTCDINPRDLGNIPSEPVRL